MQEDENVMKVGGAWSITCQSKPQQAKIILMRPLLIIEKTKGKKEKDSDNWGQFVDLEGFCFLTISAALSLVFCR